MAFQLLLTYLFHFLEKMEGDIPDHSAKDSASQEKACCCIGSATVSCFDSLDLKRGLSR